MWSVTGEKVFQSEGVIIGLPVQIVIIALAMVLIWGLLHHSINFFLVTFAQMLCRQREEGKIVHSCANSV